MWEFHTIYEVSFRWQRGKRKKICKSQRTCGGRRRVTLVNMSISFLF